MAGCGSSEIRSGSIERKSERGIGSIRTSYESAKRISLSFEPFSPRHAGSFYSLITVLRGQRPDMYIYISFPQEHSTFVSASRNAEQTSRVTRFRRVFRRASYVSRIRCPSRISSSSSSSSPRAHPLLGELSAKRAASSRMSSEGTCITIRC